MAFDGAGRAVREIALAGCFVVAFSCAVEAKAPTNAECDTARAKLAELTSDGYSKAQVIGGVGYAHGKEQQEGAS